MSDPEKGRDTTGEGRDHGLPGRNLMLGGGGSVPGSSSSSAISVAVLTGEAAGCGALGCREDPVFVVDHPDYTGDRVLCPDHALKLVEKPPQASESVRPEAEPSPERRREAGGKASERQEGPKGPKRRREPQRRLSDCSDEDGRGGDGVN